MHSTCLSNADVRPGVCVQDDMRHAFAINLALAVAYTHMLHSRPSTRSQQRTRILQPQHLQVISRPRDIQPTPGGQLYVAPFVWTAERASRDCLDILVLRILLAGVSSFCLLQPKSAQNLMTELQVLRDCRVGDLDRC